MGAGRDGAGAIRGGTNRDVILFPPLKLKSFRAQAAKTRSFASLGCRRRHIQIIRQRLERFPETVAADVRRRTCWRQFRLVTSAATEMIAPLLAGTMRFRTTDGHGSTRIFNVRLAGCGPADDARFGSSQSALAKWFFIRVHLSPSVVECLFNCMVPA